MRKLLILAALLFPAAALADPAITDQKAAKQLLGKHALTLQWIGTAGALKDAGIAEVRQEGGEWRLTGRNDAKDGFVSLDGIVTHIDKARFTFKGKIVTRVEFIYDGKECPREGEYVFERKGSRKYWRMYPIENPCDAVADYIDIFMR